MHAIVPARIEDLADIAALIAHVIDVSVDASPQEKAAFVQNTQRNLERWRLDGERSVHLKCTRDGALVGVVLVRDCWNLCHLFVQPEHQSRGVGRALVEAAIARCAGRSEHGYLRLNAARNAVGFYRRLGFVPAAGEPALHGAVRFELKL
jgi:GNAT superfamily N-acetyltransferase